MSQITRIYTSPWEKRQLNPLEHVAVAFALTAQLRSRHDKIDLTTLATICLTCGSIVSATSPSQRDLIVEYFDLTCCHRETTVVFHSS